MVFYAGRGRGEGGFYQRSFDEVEGAFGRGGREMHRSQSWEERYLLKCKKINKIKIQIVLAVLI